MDNNINNYNEEDFRNLITEHALSIRTKKKDTFFDKIKPFVKLIIIAAVLIILIKLMFPSHDDAVNTKENTIRVDSEEITSLKDVFSKQDMDILEREVYTSCSRKQLQNVEQVGHILLFKKYTTDVEQAQPNIILMTVCKGTLSDVLSPQNGYAICENHLSNIDKLKEYGPLGGGIVMKNNRGGRGLWDSLDETLEYIDTKYGSMYTVNSDIDGTVHYLNPVKMGDALSKEDSVAFTIDKITGNIDKHFEAMALACVQDNLYGSMLNILQKENEYTLNSLGHLFMLDEEGEPRELAYVIEVKNADGATGYYLPTINLSEMVCFDNDFIDGGANFLLYTNTSAYESMWNALNSEMYSSLEEIYRYHMLGYSNAVTDVEWLNERAAEQENKPF